MIKDLVILGAGGHAREVEFLLEDINALEKKYNFVGYVDSHDENVGKELGSSSIIGTEKDLVHRNLAVVLGIGNPFVNAKIIETIKAYPNLSFPNLFHPNVIWNSKRTVLGQGNTVCAGNVLTVDIKFGNFNFINRSCTIGHDIQFEDFCLVNPGANISGGVILGRRCLIGAGATILQYKKIGEDAVVGAGAVVTKDVLARTTVVGNPAKLLIRHPQ